MNKQRIRRALSVLLCLCLLLLIFPVSASAAEATILQANMVYCLRNVGSGKYLTVHNGTNANGTNIYQMTENGRASQQFVLEYSDSTNYTLRAMCSSNGTNRRVSAVSGTAGANVVLANPTTGTNQQFTLQGAGSRSFYLYCSAGTNLVLSAYGSSDGSSSGTGSSSAGNVFLQTYAGTDNQKWVLELYSPRQSVASGRYYVINANSAKAMEARTNDYNVYQTTRVNTIPQQWDVIYEGGGYYSLRPVIALDRRLDVYNAWDTEGNNIQIHTANGHDAQKFQIIPCVGTTTYRIVPAISDSRTVCVASPYTTNLANVEIQTYTGNPNQRWTFVLIEEYEPYGEMGWSWVFANNAHTSITSGYRTSSRRFHCGIDVASGYSGTEILSPTTGRVAYIYDNHADGGHYVIVKTNSVDPNGNNIRVGFMHMQAESSPLQVNDTVTTGTVIGKVGTTGDSTGPHLHLSMWNNPNRNNSWYWGGDLNAINPQRFFPQITFTGDLSNSKP